MEIDEEAGVTFPGFEAADFEVFTIPDFADRMAAIRERVRPKLAALGADLRETVEQASGRPAFPHVAQHMRRRVNPPEETWVAFCRDKKGYKRWTHYRVAVSAAGVRVTTFVEDDADDKPAFGARLAATAPEILGALGKEAPLLWYTLGEAPTAHADVTVETLCELGGRLQRLKTVKFQAGVPLAREEAAGDPAAFEDWARAQIELLAPLYRTGI